MTGWGGLNQPPPPRIHNVEFIFIYFSPSQAPNSIFNLVPSDGGGMGEGWGWGPLGPCDIPHEW